MHKLFTEIAVDGAEEDVQALMVAIDTLMQEFDFNEERQFTRYEWAHDLVELPDDA